MQAKGNAAKTYRMRLVLQLHQQGHTQSSIAHTCGLSQGRISQILKQYAQADQNTVLSKSPPGRPAALGSSELEILKQTLKKEAQQAAFPTDGWTLMRIRVVIEQQFGLHYSLEHIRRLLKKIGFTRQRPQRRDYRRNDQAVQQWKEETLPALKKSPTGGA